MFDDAGQDAVSRRGEEGAIIIQPPGLSSISAESQALGRLSQAESLAEGKVPLGGRRLMQSGVIS